MVNIDAIQFEKKKRKFIFFGFFHCRRCHRYLSSLFIFGGLGKGLEDFMTCNGYSKCPTTNVCRALKSPWRNSGSKVLETHNKLQIAFKSPWIFLKSLLNLLENKTWEQPLIGKTDSTLIDVQWFPSVGELMNIFPDFLSFFNLHSK